MMASLFGRVIPTAVAAFVLAGCGGASVDPADHATPEPIRSAAGSGMPAAIPGGGLTVSEALASDLDGPLTVTGVLIQRDGELRLCETVAEPFPPQCGDPNMIVTGVDLAGLEGAQNEQGVTWIDQVSLTGTVDGDRFDVSDTSI